jgi:hypothetical protein
MWPNTSRGSDSVISSRALEKMATYIESQVTSGRITVNNNEIEMPVYRVERSGNRIKIFLYAGNSIQGSITKYKLIDKDGEVFAEKLDNISKPNTKGLLILFEFTISEVL